MSALREAFVDELMDLLDAERQLLVALPKMAKAAQNDGLRAAFQEHQAQTEEQIKRLGLVFGAFEEPPRGKKCKGMKGLIDEGEEKIEKREGDAALIAAAQKAEHYEIAAYGTLISWAVALGHDEIVPILNEILAEEKAADKKLTMLAQTVVNLQDTLRDAVEMEDEKPRRSQPKRRKSRTPLRSTRVRMVTQGRRTGPTKKNLVSKAPRSKRSAATRR